MSNQENKITFDTLATLLPYHVRTNQVPFLAGEPGIGKSATIKNLAKEFDTKVFVLSVNGISTKEDLTGARMIEDKEAEYGAKQVFFPSAVVQNAVNYANANPDKPVILFLDEINRTTPDVTSAFMAVITERRVGDVELPSNIRLIAAGNDSGNVSVLDSASISRMQVYHVIPDVQTYLDAQKNLNYYIKNILTTNPELLTQTKSTSEDESEDPDEEDFDSMDENDQMKQISVPRTLTYMSEFLNELGFDGKSVPKNLADVFDPIDPKNSALAYAIQATLGDTQTAEKLFETLTDSINTLTMEDNDDDDNDIVNMPEPNQDILSTITNDIQSDDDVDELFNDNQYSNEDFINTFFTLIQPKTYRQLKFPDAINRYYYALTNLVDDDTQLLTPIAKNFNELLIKSQVAQPVIEYIQDHSDSPLSNQLNLLISVQMN